MLVLSGCTCSGRSSTDKQRSGRLKVDVKVPTSLNHSEHESQQFPHDRTNYNFAWFASGPQSRCKVSQYRIKLEGTQSWHSYGFAPANRSIRQSSKRKNT
jgi:hypothetical protein